MEREELEKAYDEENGTLAIEGEFGVEELKMMVWFLTTKIESKKFKNPCRKKAKVNE